MAGARYALTFPLVNIPVFYSPARQSRVSLGSIMGHILNFTKTGDWLMPRRKIQPAIQEGLASRIKAMLDSATALKVGILIGGIVFGFWNNSIQLEQTKLKAELADVRATAVKERESSQSQITTIKNKQDACEQKYDKALKAIHDAAKRLPPSPQKRQILTLTKPQQNGKVEKPALADPVPKYYVESALPRMEDSRYFNRKESN